MKGVWKEHKLSSGDNYGQRAQKMLDGMFDAGMIQDAK